MCVAMVILLVAAAFSVDIAYMHLTRQELHIATDAAAKAAVARLSLGGTAAQAKQAAVACAAANTVGGSPLAISTSDVSLGSVNYVQNARWGFNPGGTPTMAAKVDVAMTSGSTSGPVNLLFGKTLGTPIFQPSSTSVAAFVRNKVCLCFDRSRSMTFDLTGQNEKWPTSSAGYPQGVPSSVRSVSIGTKTYDFRWLYPPCNGSRWSYLGIASNAYLDALATAPVETHVALVTWASSTDNAQSKDVNNKYHTYTGSTLNTSSSKTSYSASSLESTFVTSYGAIRAAITEKSGRTMLGGTDTNSGLQNAVNLFAQTEDGIPCNKIIILFSDGMWSEGFLDPAAHAAVNAAQANIVVHTVGFMLTASDAQYGNQTMANIAAATGGKFYRATDGDSLRAAFEELARNLPIILTH